MAKKNKNCPICGFDWYNTKDHEQVCERHLNWVVTNCEKCLQLCFSYCPKICPECINCVTNDDRKFAFIEEEEIGATPS